MLMQFGNSQGWCYATGTEIEKLKELGWKESSEEERRSIIAKKHAKPDKSDTIESDGKPKGKPGRKPRNKADGSRRWRQLKH